MKLYKADGRKRADTEWQALTHMAEHRVTGVPAPLWYAPDTAHPATGMTLVPGRALLASDQPQAAIPTMAPVLRALRGIPLGPFAHKPRNGTAQRYINRLTETWLSELTELDRDPLARDLLRLLRCWLDGDDRHTLSRSSCSPTVTATSTTGTWRTAPPSPTSLTSSSPATATRPSTLPT